MANSKSIITAATARRQLAATLGQDARERQRATNLLTPEAISAGKIGASQLMMKTLGGKLRVINAADLRKFQSSAIALGKKFSGGITAKQVISLSLEPDKARAQEQIHTAFPVSNRGGIVQFQTNAGPDSNKLRHQVLVDFSNFGVALVTPAKNPATTLKTMIDGPIKIECDCEHWRYTYRYVATVGKFNAGRAETAFPKIKNPQLQGIACKHVLRVMQVVAQSPAFGGFAKKMIERGRARVGARIEDVSKAQAKAFIKAAAAETPQQRAIAETRLLKSNRKLMEKAKVAVAAVSKNLGPKGNKARGHIESLVRLGVLTRAQATPLLKKIKD